MELPMTVTATAVTQCNCVEGCLPTGDELSAGLDSIINEYKSKQGGLIPALQTLQSLYGYLPESVIRRVADGFGKPLSEVTGVITFYSFFTLHPRGKFVIRVCLGTACYVRGGKEVLDALKKRLEIDVGETTPDRMFSLEVGRCFGACGMAPVVMVNDDVYQRVKPALISELITSILSKASEVETGEGQA